MADNFLTSTLVSYNFSTPKNTDRVYKEECVYCFKTATSEKGLYVCLSSLLGVCVNHLQLHISKAKKNIFLNIKKNKVKKRDGDPPPEKRPTKLAIGVESGFNVDDGKVEYEELHCLTYVDTEGMETHQIPLPEPTLPLNAQVCIAAVLSHDDFLKQDEVNVWQEQRVVSKHALNLNQLENGKKIPPSGWACAQCELNNNLWLNLTDGTILCGRKYFDGTGGNNHAVDYYKQTGYPLAVKLGTITSEGGDVYSYDEDDMVEDPKLSQHLQHFGINITQLSKTEKTMTELEIEANLSLKNEWEAIQESGTKLVPLYGSGYTGMINMGNSCYINSVMQVLFSMGEFNETYVKSSDAIFKYASYDPTRDLSVQLSKLGVALLSNEYSQPVDDTNDQRGIRPQMIKTLIGKDHHEFSTNHQQDAHEYFLHLLESIEKIDLAHPILKLFSFQLEDRFECSQSKKVSYKRRAERCMTLPIPLSAATNTDEFKEFERKRKEAEVTNEPLQSIVRLKIPFAACLEELDETIDDFYSSAINAKTTAKKSTRFSSFPEYLVFQLRKFTVGDDWMPKKLDVSVEMPDVLDLNYLRSSGLQPHEEELPESNPEVTFNEDHVNKLKEFGFTEPACKRSLIATDNRGIEEAMNWLFEHSQDPNINTPLTAVASSQPDPSSVAMIASMGFSEHQAKRALEKNQNNLESAAEWIFTHLDELNSMEVDEPKDSSSFVDGCGKYKLFAFISHMGKSTSCGHYVCHVYKDDRWVIYNDRKVAASLHPPTNLGYLYFYRRIGR